jgi:hypothetical protein
LFVEQEFYSRASCLRERKELLLRVKLLQRGPARWQPLEKPQQKHFTPISTKDGLEAFLLL